MHNFFSNLSNLQNHHHFRLDGYNKVYQHTGGRKLIHGIKHRKDNQLQNLELPMYDILVENLNMI